MTSLLINKFNSSTHTFKLAGNAAPPLEERLSRAGVNVEHSEPVSHKHVPMEFRGSNIYRGRKLFTPRELWIQREWKTPKTDYRYEYSKQRSHVERTHTREDFEKLPLNNYKAGRAKPRIDRDQIGTRVFHRETYDSQGISGRREIVNSEQKKFRKNDIQPSFFTRDFVDRESTVRVEDAEKLHDVWRKGVV